MRLELGGQVGGAADRGGQRRRFDAHWPSNMAPIGAKLCQNAFQTIPIVSIFDEKTKNLARFFGLDNRFTPFWCNFGGSAHKRTSKSSSSQFFALDAPILRSVRPKNIKNMSVGAPGSATCRRTPPPLAPTPPI